MTKLLNSNAALEPTGCASLEGAATACQPETLLDKVQRILPELCVEDVFPVPAWFSDQNSWIQDPWKSNSVVYNLPMAWYIQGTLGYDALRQAIQRVQQRHQVLRSVYRVIENQLLQIVLRASPVTPAVADLTGRHRDEAEASARELLLDAASRPLDLAREPGLRIQVVQFAPQEAFLLLTTHLLVCDDWSTGIMFSEIFAFYRTFSCGDTIPPPEVNSFQYGDFIRWQQRQLDGKGLESRISFWKGQLANCGDFHHLEVDHARPAFRTYRGAVERQTLPEQLTHSLKALSQQERVSLFMTMLAAFQCLLHRYCGQDDIAVGSCAANRTLTEVEGLIGRFANALIIRTRVSANPTFRELLARVRNQALTAYSYQDLPFARLLDEVAPQSDPGRNRLFQVMFILRDAPKGTSPCPELTVTQIPLDMGMAKYDLCVWLSIEQGLQITLEYNADLFEAATIRQILHHYHQSLETMVKDPEGRIDADWTQKSRMPTDLLPCRGTRQGTATHTQSSPRAENSICDVSSSSAAASVDSRFAGNVSEPPKRNDDIESQLISIWEVTFDKRPIALRDDFFELGGNSLLAARLFMQIEKTFKVKLPLATLIQAATIERLAHVIRESGAENAWRSVVAIQPGNNRRLPLFCAHGQSGNLIIYRILAKHLGRDQPVYGLQPQGLDGRQPPLTCIEDMAAKYVAEIRLIQQQGPYFLVGYCMGGTIALEMAQQLHKQGQSVGLLALLDTYNWVRLQGEPLRNRIYYHCQRLWFSWKHFLQMSSRNRRDSVHARLYERYHLSEVRESNRRAALSYVPKLYPGRVLHVRPLRQFGRYEKPELGWDELITGGVESLGLATFPGQMLEEPFVRDLAMKLRAYMQVEN